MRFIPFFPVILAAVMATSSAVAALKPGQFEIQGQNATQQICLQADGTWYGTTFNWSGRWSAEEGSLWELHGNYAVGNEPYGYGNSSIGLAGKYVKWYDWFDDDSYSHFEVALFSSVKKECDSPYTGANTQAASQ